MAMLESMNDLFDCVCYYELDEFDELDGMVVRLCLKLLINNNDDNRITG